MEKQTKEDIKEDMEMIQTIAFHNGVKQGRTQAISEFKEKLLDKTTCIGCSKEYEYAFKTFRHIIEETAQEMKA